MPSRHQSKLKAVADYKHQASLKSDLARTDLAKEKQEFGLVLMPLTLLMAKKSQSGLRTMFLLVMEQVLLWLFLPTMTA